MNPTTGSGAHLEAPTSELESSPRTRDAFYKRISLKWRIAAFTAFLLLIFAAVLAGTVLRIVSNTLEDYQRDLLERDADRVQRSLELPQLGPTGLGERLIGVTKGTLFKPDGSYFDGAQLAIPTTEVVAATTTQRFWQDENGGHPIRVTLRPINMTFSEVNKQKMILAVSTDATYILDLSKAISTAVGLVTAILFLAALAGGYLAASFGLRPLVSVAKQAAKLDEHHLEPLSYNGPRDELGLLTVTLNQMVKRLRRAFDAQKVFLAETSHELRTPLTALQGYLRRALREARPESRAILEDALRVSDSMNRLVGDVLQLSRGEVVREVVPHLVDLGEVAEHVAREFNVADVQRSGALETIGDPDRLAQLVRNLIANAVRAAGKPEGVHLEVSNHGEVLELHVRDDGPGIPVQVLPHIFEKFYRGQGGGSGLGLAIVAQIARAHQGNIRAENQMGKGAHFIVTLPALQDEE